MSFHASANSAVAGCHVKSVLRQFVYIQIFFATLAAFVHTVLAFP